MNLRAREADALVHSLRSAGSGTAAGRTRLL